MSGIRDARCPRCDAIILRNHHCRASGLRFLTPAEVAASAAYVRSLIRPTITPAEPPPLQLTLKPDPPDAA